MEQSKRKEIRAEQEKELARKKKEEEDALKKAEAEKKAAEAEAKKKAMEEAEIKRQEMLAAQKEKGGKSSAPAMDARKELSKSKEQVEEECRISLNIRLKPLQLDAMDSDELKNKAKRIWESIVTLETDKYDYEQRKLDQEYEMKELKERQKLQMRNKAIKKGLDPEAFCGLIPQGYTCSPSTRDEQTQGHTERGKSCTKVVPRSSEQSGSSPCGRTRTQNGPRDQRPGCPSGSVRDPARSPETPRPLRVRRPPKLRLRKKRNTMRMRRNMTRRRKSNLFTRTTLRTFHTCHCFR